MFVVRSRVLDLGQGADEVRRARGRSQWDGLLRCSGRNLRATAEDLVNVRAPCVRCGMMLHTGEGRVTISFTVAELDEMVFEISNMLVRERLLCAIGLLDEAREKLLRQQLHDWRDP